MASVKLAALTAAALLLSSAAARADVEISNKPTSNMSCVSGVCSATAQKAVLNVSDLATMLASGDVAVKTGMVAKDIDVDQPLQWTSTARLILDAQQSVTVNKQVTVAGQGALTVTTNDTGDRKNGDGEFIIVPEHGSVQFWDLSSRLIIDGNSFTLVGDIKTLASDITANPSGFYALAKPYDASVDGTYTAAPIDAEFDGTFHGLGNEISDLNITVEGFVNRCGLFAIIGKSGTVADTHLTNIKFQGNSFDGIGGIANLNEGVISRSSAAGEFPTPDAGGGLVSDNQALIIYSFARVKLDIINAGLVIAGGLVAYNGGVIRNSYSQGSIIVRGSEPTVGGLAGENAGEIDTSYSVGTVIDGHHEVSGSFGGLVGTNDYNGTIRGAYAAGAFKIKPDRGNTVQGGLVGTDSAAPGGMSSSYWDVDNGISNPSQGAGNIPNDPGITGLTTTQFQSKLPKGFDPKIWGSDPKINNGYPYLLANRPQ